MRQASETLAGRVDYVDLSPIDALELPAQVGDVNRLWIRGGFPDGSVAVLPSARTTRLGNGTSRGYCPRTVPLLTTDEEFRAA